MWLLIKPESVQKQPLLSHLKSLRTKTIIILLLSLLIVSVQDTNSLMTSWQAHWYGSVSLLSTRSLSSGHYRLLLRPFPWQQHDWCLLLAIRTNSLEANHDCPVVCCCGLKTDSVVIIKGRDFSRSEAPKTARHFPLGYVHSTPFSREAQLSSSLSALSQAQVADISRQQKEQEGVGGGIKGYCSPDTQAAVRCAPSCWPLSEQCQVKFLSWPVLRSHSISNTNSTTVTLPWWAAGTQTQKYNTWDPRWHSLQSQCRGSTHPDILGGTVLTLSTVYYQHIQCANMT